MRKILITIIIIVSVSGFSCKSGRKSDIKSATVGYFIDGRGGNDTNYGDLEHPVRTIDRLNKLLQEKTGNIFFTGGQIYNGTLLVRNSTGENRDTVCISFNDARTTEGAGSIFIWNGSGESRQMTGCLIHNNVFYNSSAPVISFENESAHENFIFCNNIFMGGDNIFSGINSGSSFLGNVWWSTKGTLHLMEYSSLVEWAEAYSQEMMNGQIIGIEADPGLNGPLDVEITDPYQLNALNGYTLKSDSPLRNKGIDIKTVADRDYPETDFFGNPVPLGKAPEAGIFEMR